MVNYKKVNYSTSKSLVQILNQTKSHSPAFLLKEVKITEQILILTTVVTNSKPISRPLKNGLEKTPI